MAEGGAERERESEEMQRVEYEKNTDDQDQNSQEESNVDELCPITDKDEKPFRLMDMPPEIRIEIYRACLTRPFDILLSREVKAVEVEKNLGRDEGEDAMFTAEREEEVGALVDAHTDAHLPASAPHALSTLQSDLISTLQANDAPSNTGVAAALPPPSGTRTLRSTTRNNNLQRMASASASTNTDDSITDTAAPAPMRRARLPTNARVNSPMRGRRVTPVAPATPRAPRPQDVDPLSVNLLRTSKLVYKEARAILYGENSFRLDLDTAQPTLAALHQRSRGQIKYLRVTIPTHNEILERFAEVVRLSLRYCWRLQRFIIHTPFVLPGAEGSSTSGNTTVYANAFDILRWLPRQCEVVLEGNVCEEIRRVVEKNSNLAKSLDEVSFSYFHSGGHVSFKYFQERGLNLDDP